MNYYVSIL